MMIRAEYGGCGKSYTCKSMETRGHKVLFVCPTNKPANNYKEHGCTINKFFGMGLTESTKLAKFDDSGYDTIVLDIILLRKEPREDQALLRKQPRQDRRSYRGHGPARVH
ncbi:MAG: hypothetical protein ACKPKO_15445 [Candidatus Fonsibacter sp.]